jgi:hypothetical protein
MASKNVEGVTFRSLLEVIIASGTVDIANAADADTVAAEVTVPGAALGDFVLVSLEVDVADLTLDAQVTAANTVTITVNNNTGGAINLAAATYRLMVLQPGEQFEQL